MDVLKLTAEDKNLDYILDFINQLLEKHECAPYALLELDIAVEEIFVNVAHYAYNPEIGEVVIEVSFEENGVSISFIDDGKPYNPLEKKDPDTSLGEEQEIGGFGIYMVKNSMDAVDYEYRDGKNILTIKKKIK